MIEVKQKFNVDTLIVEDTLVSISIGDIVEVISDFSSPIDPTIPAPIGWSLGQVPTPPLRTHVLEVIGESMTKGSMTFKAVGPGNAYVTYRMEEPFKEKETHFVIS